MLTSVKGTYENGVVFLLEKPVAIQKSSVIVTFLDVVEPETKRRKPGGLKGKVHLPDDFNEPLDELREYMF